MLDFSVTLEYNVRSVQDNVHYSAFRSKIIKEVIMYISHYEVTSANFFSGLVLDPAYAGKAITSSLIVGFLAFALILFAAIAIKKGRALGIIAAILQPIGAYAAAKSVIEFGNMDFSSLNIKVTASTQQAAMDAFMDKYTDALMTKIMPQMIMCIIWGMLLTVVVVITLVYIVTLLKAKAKGIALFALIVAILRLFVSPINVFAILLNQANAATQSVWDLLFRAVFILPAFLVAIQGIINLASKDKPATAEAAPVEAAPVEAAPAVEEAPAEAAEEATESTNE